MTNPNPSQKKNLRFANAIALKELGELELTIGYSSNIFMIFGLPTQQLSEGQVQWVKENKKYTFTLTQTHKGFEIPYGCYARMNQIFIDTEVKTKNTKIIDLGNTFNKYIEKLGYEEGRAYRGVKKQLSNLIRCSIGITAKTPDIDAGTQMLVGRKWFISLDEHSPDQLELFKSQIILDEVYANYILKHAVPLDMEVIRFFNRNPHGLDFYRFLAYRNNNLSKPIVMLESDLFDQLGTCTENTRMLKLRSQEILRQIQAYWQVNAKFEDGYFHLFPSPPAVRPRTRLGGPSRIVYNPVDK